MSKENKVSIKNRLFFKLYVNYAIMLLVTAILICLIFMRQYEDIIMENHKDQVQGQAENIADMMVSDFIRNYKYEEFLEFYNNQEKVTGLDLWTISNPYALKPMDEGMATNSFEEIKGSEYEHIVSNAFMGYEASRVGSDDIYGVPMFIVAVPIQELGGEVIGAVMLFSKVEGQRDIVMASLRVIVFSSVIALAISFLIIIVFATELALPISRMRLTALALAAGNYNSKTGINRKDEIGDLAKTVDILSDKLLENDIQRRNLDAMRHDFFANISHELRTPITVIRAYTETLVDGVVQDKETVDAYYDRMLSECKSMERLVGDLMLVSKMQNPDFVIEREPVNLVQIFDDIIRSAGAIAAKKHITIEVIKDGPMYMMLGDYDRLRQMFMVILDNAIKFSDENKKVHINLSKSERIIVSIRDEGIGIEQADLSNIFEKFYKSNLRHNASGTGLGLAIAKQIALKHDGTIEVESVLGQGSKFTFKFPSHELDC